MGQKASTGTGSDIEEQGGILGIIARFLGIGGAWDSANGAVENLFELPEMVITIVKWVAIGAAVLAAIFIIVFIWRMAKGNTPDVAGGVAQIVSMTPQGQLARMATGGN